MDTASIPRHSDAAGPARRPRRWAWVAAVALIAVLAASCGSDGGSDPTAVPESTDSGQGASEATAAPQSEDTGEVSRSADAAPDFELTLFENGDHSAGEVLRLSDLVGKPVVLNHWFPSCPPCVAEMPDFEVAYQKYKDQVVFIGVQNMGVDTAEDGQEFVNSLGVNYAVGPDNNPNNDIQIFIAHKVTGFPTTEFLNREQEVVRKWSGLLDAEKLDELIQELLAE